MQKILFAPLALSLFILGCPSDKESLAGKGDSASDPGAKVSLKDLKPTVSDLKEGKGPTAKNGDRLYVLYRGTLNSGQEFDSNLPKDKPPFSFVLGTGQVIQGWDLGLVGMKVGGKRSLKIPAALAYGNESMGPIPPNSDLNFDVELLYTVKPGEEDTFESEDETLGTGAEAKKGLAVTVHYTGTLLNGLKFDSSLDRGQPFQFELGKGAVIRGWDAGIPGMRVGGKRRLIISPEAAYGASPKGDKIPANSVLVFEIELLGVK